eukprot:CAMPEP_0198144022 /NCGR_PEP_ID=MMETSP1443-20131203/12365_1 /TAXON_ID=186043 /ORGANISM="Entomoneis sp., Strain CCMP2396" /LENGTH=193 /DNA_ID=CAMNT_0043807343 /DNA_START=314 /DNA_END=895 /DNA_ORIENTATION=+
MTTSSQAKRQETCLNSNNIFDDFKNFFDFGGDNNKKRKIDQSNNSNDDIDDDDDDDLPAGEYRIVTIPFDDIKPGALRLFLMFYLLGLQNTPEPKTWMANQPTTEDYVIDYRYHDKSAVMTITMDPKSKFVSVTRLGSNPSTAYLMQESVVIQGFLDELQTMATDDSVTPENRLIRLHTEDAIEQARDKLAFG